MREDEIIEPGVVVALRKLRQEFYHKFKASLGYKGRSCLNMWIKPSRTEAKQVIKDPQRLSGVTITSSLCKWEMQLSSQGQRIEF